MKGPKTDNKVNRSFQNPGGRSCSALGRGHHDNSKTRSVKVPKSIRGAHRRGRGTKLTDSQRRHRQIRGGSRGDHSTSSRGPAASGEPSAGGRLRRRTVEYQSSLLMKNDPTPRLPPTRTTSVGQVGHRRRAMSAASRLS